MNLRTFETNTSQELKYNDICVILKDLVNENKKLKIQMNDLQNKLNFVLKRNKEMEAQQQIIIKRQMSQFEAGQDAGEKDDSIVLQPPISFDEWVDKLHQSITIEDVLLLETHKIEDIIAILIKKNTTTNINHNPFYVLKKNETSKSNNSLRLYVFNNPEEGFIEITEIRFENFIRLIINCFTKKLSQWKKNGTSNQDDNVLEKFILISKKIVSIKYTKKIFVDLIVKGFSTGYI